MEDLQEINTAVESYGDEEDTQKDKYLSFRIADEFYAIEIRYVKEIFGIQKITSVPNVREYIKGIINLRGIIIPIVDVRLRFKLTETEYDEKTCIIVVNYNETPIGLIVDEVSEVLNLPESKIKPPPQTNKGSKSRFIAGIGKDGEEVKMILNLGKFLYDDVKNKDQERHES